MNFDLTGIDQKYLGATRPFEVMIVTYIQIYEKMVPAFSENLLVSDWDSILASLDLIVKYLSEIKTFNISSNFKTMRDLYVEIIQESIKEIEKAIEND